MRCARLDHVQLLPLMALIFQGGFASSALASTPNLGPKWSSYSHVREQRNCSYLNDLSHIDSNNPFQDLLDPKTVLGLNQRYQDLNRDYELKRKYSLNDRVDEQRHGDEIHGFGRQIFGEVRRYKTSQEAARLKVAVEREDTLRALVKPAAVVGVGAAIYNGTPVSLAIDDETRLRAVANVPTQTGQFSLLSSLGTTSLDLNMNKQDPNQPYMPEASSMIERYRVSHTRGLPIWNLSSGLSYGTTTGSVGASLSKPLAPNLTAVVDTLRPLQSGRFVGEETLKLFYGLQF